MSIQIIRILKNQIFQFREVIAIRQRSRQQKRQFHRIGGDILIHGLIRGIGHLYDSTLNKGLAFTIEERQKLGIHGMLPPVVISPNDQAELAKIAVDQYENNDQKYVYLQDLQLRNERLFYRVIIENLEELLPVIYSPTMKLACTQLNIVYRRPRGIYITIFDRGHCLDILRNWPDPVQAICVTDGARVFGIGDIGAYGIAIPIGKMAVYTVAGLIKPFKCLPVLIDVGTDNEEYMNKKWYIGIRQKRVSDEQEAELLDEFIKAAHRRFGDKLVIHYEDFKPSVAYSLMDKYRDKYCVFSGDIQIPGCLILSGLISAMKSINGKLSDNRILFFGSGQPAVGTADLCVEQMVAEGTLRDEAKTKIWMMDRHGLLVQNRENLKGHMKNYVRDMEPITDLLEVIKKVEPTILIGLSRKEDAFTPEVLAEMAKLNARPVVFAMGNPCGKPECSAEDAIKHTEGRVLFATNELLAPVTREGKTYQIACANNAMIFPGIVLGAMLCGIQKIPDDILIHVSSALSDFMTYSEIEEGKLYPPIKRIPDYALKIAEVVIRKGYEKDLATVKPIPVIIPEFIKKNQYTYVYQNEPPLPAEYTWKNLLKEVKPKEMIIKDVVDTNILSHH